MAYIKNANQAASYAKFRPSPPSELIEKIVTFLNEKNNQIALDVGCGSGQSTRTLAPYFGTVIGIDNSPEQVQQAEKNNKLPNVKYRLGNAENLAETDASVDLVTVGMALHWFDLGKFTAQVSRVLRKDGVFAVYGYNLPHPLINNTSYASFWQSILMERLELYFPKGSKQVYFDGYKGQQFAKFSFSKNPTLRYEFLKKKRTSISELLGYVSSMSGYQNFLTRHGEEEAQVLLNDLKQRFLDHIDSPTDEKDIDIVFPYFLLLSRKEH